MSLYLRGICLYVYVIYVINMLYVHVSRMFKNFNRLKALCQSWVKSYQRSKVKVGVLRPVQQPGSYWDRSSELPLVGLEPTEVTAYD